MSNFYKNKLNKFDSNTVIFSTFDTKNALPSFGGAFMYLGLDTVIYSTSYLAGIWKSLSAALR